MYASFPLKPGVVRDDTRLAARGYAVDADRILWRNGRFEWQRGYRDLLGSTAARVDGCARTIATYTTVRGETAAVLGSDAGLWAYRSGILARITPFKSSASGTDAVTTQAGSDLVTVTMPAHMARPGDTAYLRAAAVGGIELGRAFSRPNPFYATSGSSLLTVSEPGHGLAAGDVLVVSGATPYGGLDPNGERCAVVIDADTWAIDMDAPSTASGPCGGTVAFVRLAPYPVVSVPSDSTFLVRAPAPASATAMGGGAFLARIELSPGRRDGVPVTGYGVGPFGVGPYGTDATPEGKASLRPRTWSLPVIGEAVFPCVRGGTPHQWYSTLSRRAVPQAGAPAKVDVLIATSERKLMALGVTMSDGTYDPLGWRWTDTLGAAIDPTNPIDWSLDSAATLAGQDRAVDGSEFVGALVTPKGIVAWTESSALSVQYVADYSVVYRMDLAGSGAGLVGPNAALERNGIVWWLAPTGFHRMQVGGVPEKVPSPLEREVLAALDPDQLHKTFAVFDSDAEAVSWHYVDRARGKEVSRYARLDTKEQSDRFTGWSPGTSDQVAWIDHCRRGFANPLSARADGMLCEQGVGTTLAGAPMNAFLETAYLEADVSEQGQASGLAEYLLNLDKLTFDASIRGGARVSFRCVRQIDDAAHRAYGPWLFTDTRKTKCFRAQGRFVAMRVEGVGVEASLRSGDIRFDATQGPRQ